VFHEATKGLTGFAHPGRRLNPRSAGQKFLEGASDYGGVASLFAALIVIYTAVGGFRGSVYADTLQAMVRVIGTAIAIIAVGVVASRAPPKSATSARPGTSIH
jgi:Na+/proline symporter